MKRIGGALLALLPVLGLLGSSGCGLFKTERPSGSPLEFVRKDAEVVVELRDIGMLADLRASLSQQLSAVFSPQDVKQLQAELTLVLGFDPTTLDGLAGVGLAKRGPVAAELLADGTGAVWVFPVDKPKTLAPVIETIMKARGGVDEAKTETRDGVKLTLLLVEFGEKKVVRAAHATARGHVVIGFGSEAADLVARAVSLEKTAAIQHNPEYRAMAKRLGETYDVRMVSPKGSAVVTGALRQLGRRDAGTLTPLMDRMTSAGWTFRYADGALRFDGRARLDAEGMKKTEAIFTVAGRAPDGVRAINLERAIVVGQAGGDPKALIDAVAPAESEARKELELIAEQVKRDLEIDLFGEVLPNLSGHAAFAVGTGDLTEIEFKQLVGNPAGLTWTAFAASARDAAALATLEGKLDGRLAERSVKVNKRAVGKSEVRDMVPVLPDGKTTDPLFTTFSHAGAWGFTVEPPLADAIIGNKPGPDLLEGRPGLYAELRMAQLSAELRRFKIRQLPLLYRSIVLKILDYLALVDRITLRVQPAEDGLRLRGELHFSPLAAQKP